MKRLLEVAVTARPESELLQLSFCLGLSIISISGLFAGLSSWEEIGIRDFPNIK